MSKTSLRLDKLPQPLMLSKKIPRGQHQEAQKPYRLKSDQPQNQKTGLLSDMKQELNLIKDGVEKLLVTNEDEVGLIKNTIPEALAQTLKQELIQAKQLEQRLRKQLQKLKNQSLKSIEETREAADRKLQMVRREHKQEKSNLKYKIQKGEQSIQTLKQNLQLKQNALNQYKKITEQHQSDNKASLKLLQSKYQSSLGQFKKLQQRFIKSQKGDLATVQHRLYQVQQQNSTLRMQNTNLKNQIANSTSKLQRSVSRCNELKQRNTELEDKVRIHIRNTDYAKQIEQLKTIVSDLQGQKIFLTQNLEEKKTQYSKAMIQIEQLNNKVEESQQIHKQRLQIVQLQIQLNQAKQANNIFFEQVQYLKQVLDQKQSYIEALQNGTKLVDSSTIIEQLQQKCQTLLQQKNKMIKEYQQAIMTLQNSERSFMKNSSMMSVTSRVSTNFDEILKQQIKQNDELRMNLRDKTQQVLSLRLIIGENERKIETIKSQFEIQRIRLTSQNKSTNKNLQYNYESTKYELDMLKRREETLKQKLETKIDQSKKKDEFIQKQLLQKIGKQQNQSDAKYLAQQLQKFVSLRLNQSTILNLNESIRMETPRIYKHPQLLKVSKVDSSAQ